MLYFAKISKISHNPIIQPSDGAFKGVKWFTVSKKLFKFLSIILL